MTARTVHVIVGPTEHGVVRHGLRVARACGHDIVRAPSAAEAVAQLGGSVDVVHVPFADRLFAPTCERAADEFGRVAAAAARAGASLSVTLHDVPPGGASDERGGRRAGYARVVAAATAVVVNSRVDLRAVEDLAARRPGPRLLRGIDLPIDPQPCTTPAGAGAGDDVGVLGFLYPNRGYEDVLHALPAGRRLLALGWPSDGHEDLPERLAALASQLGRAFTVSGWSPDSELPARLASVAVPVAPNRRVTSSGSIGTWLAHGRRPLVPATEYTRELAARLPGGLELYDADAPAALCDALRSALADPRRTWLDPRVRVGPSTAEVAGRYVELLRAAAPPAVLRVHGRPIVPGNRWDLLVAARPASVSVVIPYYDAQDDLDRALTALTLQSVRADLEVIVADDGSPVAPDVSAAGDLPVRVVRQAHRGFGAARARNLGFRHAHGDVIAFLDGDMVPEPAYLERLTRRSASGADLLAVGRRRHAHLDGWTPEAVRTWLRGAAHPPPLHPEPGWLTSGYADSRALLDADARSYRSLISAVLAANRGLLERIGGFDERFERYGGEDWELANRAWNAGALFAHVPDAVAWHNGPDWAGRNGSVEEKDAEAAMLAELLPDPAARRAGHRSRYPHIVVLLGAEDAAVTRACVRSAFASGADCGVWLDPGPLAPPDPLHAAPDPLRAAPDPLHAAPDPLHAAPDPLHAAPDPRVHRGPPGDDVLLRAGVVAVVRAPRDLSCLPQLGRLATDVGVVDAPDVTVYATRTVHRCHGSVRRSRPLYVKAWVEVPLGLMWAALLRDRF